MLVVGGLGTSLCPGVSLVADTFLPTPSHVLEMRGHAHGRCSSTVAGTFTLRRR